MIRFDSVTKTYAGTTRPALDDVTLEVLPGEFVFLVGASGSGKSSFLRLVLKEERPTKGRIHVLGQEIGTLASRKVPYFRRNLGVVFQDFRLLPNKTVFDNVAFTLQVIGKSKGFIQEAVPDVLKMVGLSGKQQRLPHELSGGEQQRVAIARAVVNKPAILLADEPTGNLDPATSAGIMSLLASISANGTTILMATHDVGIVDQMQRRVVELVNGRIVRDERGGGYQTTAIPIQQAADAVAPAPIATPTVTTPIIVPREPVRSGSVDDLLDAPPSLADLVAPRGETAPVAVVPAERPRAAERPPIEDDAEADALAWIRRPAFAAAPRHPAPPPASRDGRTPPPLNEPGHR